MSERLPTGPEAMSHPLPDDVLAAQLGRRAAHQAPRALAAAIMALVDETVPERRWRLAVAAWRPRMARVATGLALVLVASLLAINAMPAPVGTDRGSPSPSRSPAATGPVWDPAQRALTPSEFLRFLAAGPATGTTLIVDDQIAPRTVLCVKETDCADGQLVQAGVVVGPPAGGSLLFSRSTTIPGPLALQVKQGGDLIFLGGVVAGPRGMAVLRAPDLALRDALGGLFVVPAWLWATPPAPCPSVPGTPEPMPVSEVGLPAPRIDCVATDWLTDSESTKPVSGAGIAFPVQHGAYSAFAVDASNAAGQTNPRQGIYLVRDWAGYGEILARLEPLPIPAPATQATTAPTGPAPSATAGRVMTADEFVGRVLDGSLSNGSIVVADIPASAVSVLSPTGAGAAEDATQSRWIIREASGFIRVDGIAKDGIAGSQAFLVEPSRSVLTLGTVNVVDGGQLGLVMVHGWLRNGPPLPCPAPARPAATGFDGRSLAWSQCPGTWILPTADDPWAGPPNDAQATDGSGAYRVGDRAMPEGTLHVQDDALGPYVEATEGVWLVRRVFSNTCPPWAFCVLTPADRPGPGVSWYELVGPVAAPPPDAVEQRPPPTPASPTAAP